MPTLSTNAARCLTQASLPAALEALERNLFADRASYPPLLHHCGREKSLDSAKRVQAHLTRSGFKDDIFLANLLVQTYARCSSLADARRAFDSIPWKNAHSWNIVIAAYAQAGHLEEALELFDRMWELGAGPIHRPILTLLFRGIPSLESLRSLHDRTRVECSSDRVLATALVRSYGGFGRVEEARRAFDDYQGERDACCWTSLVAAYTQNSRPREALEIFRAMDSLPDEIAFVTAVDASALARDIGQGEWLHSRIAQEGLLHCQILATALLTLYGRCGKIDRAEEIFDRLSSRDLVAWNAMIAAYAQNGHGVAAIETFSAMDLAPNAKTYATVLDACASVGAIETGQNIHSLINPAMVKSDAVIGTAMINLYARSGMIDVAKATFDSFVTRDPVAWSSMIAAFAQNGHSREALHLFREMTDEKDVSPDAITFLGVLAACSHGGLIDHGVKHFASMIQEFEIQPVREHFGCVIDLLARTGRISDAVELLYAMPCDANEVAWTSVMNACRIHGEVEQGMVAAEEVITREPENPEAYIAMAGFLELDAFFDRDEHG